MSVLSVKDLCVTFRQGNHEVKAVDRVSFDVQSGEFFALVGESGSGKSVSAQAVMQLLPDSAEQTGSVTFDGDELLNAPESTMRTIRGAKIGMVFQEPMSALNPLHTIGRQIKEVLAIHQSLSTKQTQERIAELLKQVGLGHFTTRLDAYPHQLSGGERQRVMIAMAMANQPDLLIADEPTTALDVTLQAQVLSLLKELQSTHNMAVLLITHDLTIVKQLADRVAVMKSGAIVEQGEPATLFTTPKHAYTQQLIDAIPSGSAIPLKEAPPTLLSCDALRVQFPKHMGWLSRKKEYVTAVKDVSLTLGKGETLGLVGESGSGKTTLAMALLRLIKSHGPIVYQGSHIDHLSSGALRTLRSELQIVFQDPFASLNPRMNVADIVTEGLRVHAPQLNQAERYQKAEAMMDKIGLEHTMLSRYPHEFSGGQRQRINIARALILEPSLIVLDEPTSALDVSFQAQILALLKQFQEEQAISYLFITHDLRVIRSISHRLIVMKQGEIIESGDTETIFNKPTHDYTKTLIKAALLENH